MIKKSIFFSFVLFLCIIQTALAQLGSTCGFPKWSASYAYSQNSVVLYQGNVYKANAWTSNETPGSTYSWGGSPWTKLGVCDENLLINNPSLAYTNCAKAQDYDSSKANYDTGDLIRYQFGVYAAKFWVAGKESPDNPANYDFKGICVIPVDVVPSYVDGQVVIMPTLTSINLNATLDNHGFSVTQNSLEIKKDTDTNYTSATMAMSGNVLSYSWTPPAYGDYNIRYTVTNSVGVKTVVDTTIKIAISTPATVTINSPAQQTKYNQLSFAPININFTAQASSGNSISSIKVKDITAGTSNNVAVNSQGSYNYSWTPTKYGDNTIEIETTDDKGTTTKTQLVLVIVDPSLQSLSFSKLPNQIKAVMGVTKTFTFDADMASMLVRDPGLFDYTISGKTLKITPKRAGRSGIAIKLADGTTQHVGLRIDNADGTVPKYPDWVTVGSVSEDIDDDVNFFHNGMDNTNLLKNNRMDIRYVYVNGGPFASPATSPDGTQYQGGWLSWQADRVTKFSRNSLKMGLIPYFVFYNIPDGGESYTTNLGHIRDPFYMKEYFKNLNIFLDQVKAQVDDEFFGVILEPDFLGYMQQNSEPGTSPTSVSATTIAKNAGTLESLVNRINAELNNRRINDKLNMEFGWQFNLWAKAGVAGTRGIIRETDSGDFKSQLEKIKQTAKDIAQYGKNVGVLSHNADFVSIDKYGLDAMGYANSSNPADPSTYTWFWNNDHWMNYLDFVKSLNEAAGKPVILWQVPVGHINNSTTVNEYTGTSFKKLENKSKYYEDSASNFFFGDTVDFSNDDVRYQYFSQNVHKDSKLIADPATKKVTWGNHFQEVKASGSNIVLMGAGVGDSTDGIGKEGTTLTDDHFWIQKLQDYYINNLVPASVLATNETIKYNSPLIYPNPVSDVLNIKTTEKIESIYIFDATGKTVFGTSEAKTSLDVSNLTTGMYIVAVKLQNGKIITNKVLKK